MVSTRRMALRSHHPRPHLLQFLPVQTLRRLHRLDMGSHRNIIRNPPFPPILLLIQAAWVVASLPIRVVLGRKIRALWFDVLALMFHWIDYAFFLIILEGMAFTLRTKKIKFHYCINVTREMIHSAECDAVYATLAFASVELFLSLFAGVVVTVALQCYCWMRYKDCKSRVQRISSPGESANRVNDEGL